MRNACRILSLFGLVLAAHCGGSASSGAPFAQKPASSGSGSGGSNSSGGSSGTGSGSGSSGGNTSSSGGGQSTSSSGGSSSGTGDGGSGEGGSSTDGGDGSLCFPKVTDFTTDGPFTATSGDVASVSCTIFRPTMLGANGCLNPVIVWGNGTTNSPSSYTALFNHFATQGFIVAAADTSNAGSGMEMLTCLKYILDQNTMSGSMYEGKIDTNHIASSGYSQGGAGCLAAGEDPRFSTVLAVSPYVVISLGSYDPSMDAAKQIHPMFMISGSADTVAPINNNQQPIFDMDPAPLFWGTHAGSTHFEVLGSGGAYAGPMTAWFRWKLMNDPAARDWFEKPPCTLCTTSGWTVQTNTKWM
jgi:hypothetical protein